MSELTDGGPAFPSPMQVAYENAGEPAEYGMTLRDYFAAKALPSAAEFWTKKNPDVPYDFIAQVAYRMADAMLRVRAGARR